MGKIESETGHAGTELCTHRLMTKVDGPLYRLSIQLPRLGLCWPFPTLFLVGGFDLDIFRDAAAQELRIVQPGKALPVGCQVV
jgi:hypothetical protein